MLVTLHQHQKCSCPIETGPRATGGSTPARQTGATL
jgi:hypothetical protein